LRFKTRSKAKKEREVVIANVMDCDCKVDLVSGGLAWASWNRMGNLFWSWVWVRVEGNRSLGKAFIIECCKVYFILTLISKLQQLWVDNRCIPQKIFLSFVCIYSHSSWIKTRLYRRFLQLPDRKKKVDSSLFSLLSKIGRLRVLYCRLPD